MIRAITEQILRPIIESLEWVDVFGGVAVTTTKEAGSVENPNPITYPVMVVRPRACPPSQEPILSPDDKYKSVLWVVETSDVTSVVDERFSKRSGMTMTQTVRLMGWVNGKALGEADYHFAYTPEADLIRELHGVRLNNMKLKNIGVTADLPITRLKISVTGQSEKDHSDIFSEYTFSGRQIWFVKPYDFFAIDLELEWTVIENCIPVYTANDPLQCPPGYIPPSCGPIVSDCEGNLIKIGSDGGACLTVDDIPASTDTNFANSDLTADADRSHDFGAFRFNVQSSAHFLWGDNITVEGTTTTNRTWIGGQNHTISNPGFGINTSLIFGGSNNLSLDGSANGNANVILGNSNNGQGNIRTTYILGSNNTVEDTIIGIAIGSEHQVTNVLGGAIGGILNRVSSFDSGTSFSSGHYASYVFGGRENVIDGTQNGNFNFNTIVGGYQNQLTDTKNSTIVGGSGIVPTIKKENWVYAPSLSLWDEPTKDDTLIQVLVRDPADEGAVKYRDASTLVGANGIFDSQNEGATAQVEMIQGNDPGTHYNGAFGASFLFGGTYIQGTGRQQGGELRQADSLQGASIWVWQEFSANAENANLLIQSKDAPSIENYKFNVKGLGAKWNDYGTGALLDDTAPYALGVKSDGQIVELTKGSGGGGGNGIFDASNEGGTTAVGNVLLGQQFRFYRETGGPIFAVSSYDGAQKPQYRANLSNGTLASPTDLSNAGHAFFSFLGSIRYEGSDRYLGGLEFWSEGTGQGGEFGPSNYHSSFRIQTAKRGATSRTTALKINGHQLELPSYGVGSYTGVVSRGLAVTTDGVVIETAKESLHNGIFDIQNEGSTRAVVEMYVTDSLTYIRNDQTTGGNTLGFRMHKGSQPNWVTNSFSALATRGTEASPSALNSLDQMFAINCSAQVDSSTSVNVMQYVWRTGPNWNATTNRQTSLLIQGVEDGATSRTDIFEMIGSDLVLHKYGTGSKTGTVARGLGVDADGKVVEYDKNGTLDGIYSGSGNVPDGTEAIIDNQLVFRSSGQFTPINLIADGNALSFRVSTFSSSNFGSGLFQGYTAGGTEASPVNLVGGQRVFGFNGFWYRGGQYSGNKIGLEWWLTDDNNATETRFFNMVGGSPNQQVMRLTGSDLELPFYTGTDKDATPSKTLGVDANGKVITYAVATTQIGSIENIHITNSDFTLPLITQIGEDVIIVNPIGGGGTIHALTSPGNSFITSNTAILNGHCEVFVAVSMTQWAKVG